LISGSQLFINVNKLKKGTNMSNQLTVQLQESVDVTVQVYEGTNVFLGAQIARKARLYVPRKYWSMLEGYKNINTSDVISIAFIDGVAVGSCIQFGNGSIHCFVRKSLRRHGIGSKLVSAVKRDDSKAGIGLKNGQSESFWKHNNVTMKKRGWWM